MTDAGWVRHRVAADAAAAGMRLDKFLAAALPALSRSRLHSLIRDRRVSRDGDTVTDPAVKVKPGERFVLVIPPPPPAAPQAQAMALDVVYEDEHLIVIDKPAGMVVHPAAGNLDRTLVNALLAHCGDSLSGIGGVRRPGIVHRLDKDTSGLMVAAKSDAAHHGLAALFASHDLERAYMAVVWGVPVPAAGEIAGNIGRSPLNRKKMAVVTRGGRPAVTGYRVVRRLGTVASLVECRLETGRTHQIRVHMSVRGNPVVGDPVYGGGGRSRIARLPEAVRGAVAGFGRQALHAATLGFRHPITGATLRFSSALPEDMERLIAILEHVEQPPYC